MTKLTRLEAILIDAFHEGSAAERTSALRADEPVDVGPIYNVASINSVIPHLGLLGPFADELLEHLVSREYLAPAPNGTYSDTDNLVNELAAMEIRVGEHANIVLLWEAFNNPHEDSA